MKAFLLSMMATFTFNVAIATPPLSKQEAHKLLVQSANEFLYANFYIDRFIKETAISNDLIALKKAGYITIQPTKTAGAGKMEVMAAGKGKPLFIREENGKLYFRVADVAVNVVSVKEQTLKGKTTANVVYKEKFTRNRFLELMGVNHCFDGTEYTGKATLVYNGNGWKVEHADYR
jgi:hypothetical protein